MYYFSLRIHGKTIYYITHIAKDMIQPKWRRKLRKFGNERVVQIPHEITNSLDAEFLVITIEDGRIILTPES